MPLIRRGKPAGKGAGDLRSLLPVGLLPMLLILTLGSCGQAKSPGASGARTATPSPTDRAAPKSAYVTFEAGVSYQTAVREVTDLGLQARTFCEGVTYSPPGAAESSIGWWEPEASARDFPMTSGTDTGHGMLYVAPTPLAPSDWVARLGTSPGVLNVQVYTAEPKCALHIVHTTPPSDAVHYVPDDQVGTLVRVTFDQRMSYDSAIVLVSQLGFRLSDPCYETAKSNGQAPSWQTMGEESSFAATQELVLTVTYFNAATWHQQLAGSSGVQTVVTPVTATC